MIRPITQIGFCLSMLAIMALFVNPALAFCLGVVGVVISIYALATAGD